MMKERKVVRVGRQNGSSKSLRDSFKVAVFFLHSGALHRAPEIRPNASGLHRRTYPVQYQLPNELPRRLRVQLLRPRLNVLDA